MADHLFPTLIITGSVGVGKTSTADEISSRLKKAGTYHAVIDLDQIRYIFPRPKDDPFHRRLALKNLAAVWKNYWEAGARRLIIPSVMEHEQDIQDIRDTLPGADILVVRLEAELGTIQKRLMDRESGEELKWHLNRAEQLSGILKEASIENLVVNTENKSVEQVADEILKEWK